MDGIQVDFNDPSLDTITHIQLSMVMVALREYDVTEYPYQTVKDTFIASFGPHVSVLDISDPSIALDNPPEADLPVINDFKN